MYERHPAACVFFNTLLTIHSQFGYVIYGILTQIDVWLIIRPIHTLWANLFPSGSDCEKPVISEAGATIFPVIPASINL